LAENESTCSALDTAELNFEGAPRKSEGLKGRRKKQWRKIQNAEAKNRQSFKRATASIGLKRIKIQKGERFKRATVLKCRMFQIGERTPKFKNAECFK